MLPTVTTRASTPFLLALAVADAVVVAKLAEAASAGLRVSMPLAEADLGGGSIAGAGMPAVSAPAAAAEL